MSTLLEILYTKIESIVENPKLQISSIIEDQNFAKLLRTSVNRLKYLRRKSEANSSTSRKNKDEFDDMDDLQNKIEHQSQMPKSTNNPVNDMMNSACASFDVNTKSLLDRSKNKNDNVIK